jgi:hypothetical protein
LTIVKGGLRAAPRGVGQGACTVFLESLSRERARRGQNRRFAPGAAMSDDPRCCGSGTCIIDPEGRCWCGQQWNGEKMAAPALSPPGVTGGAPEPAPDAGPDPGP